MRTEGLNLVEEEARLLAREVERSWQKGRTLMAQKSAALQGRSILKRGHVLTRTISAACSGPKGSRGKNPRVKKKEAGKGQQGWGKDGMRTD